MKITINAAKAKELHDRLSSQVLNDIRGDKITKAIIKNRSIFRGSHNRMMPAPGSELYDTDKEYRKRIRGTFEGFAQKDDNGNVIGNVPDDKVVEFRAAMNEIDEIYKDHLLAMKEAKRRAFDVDIVLIYKKDLPSIISLEQRELILFMIHGEQDLDPILEEEEDE